MPEHPSPWHATRATHRVIENVDDVSSLIANLTPSGRKLRLGFLISGREISVVVPFEKALRFFLEVELLMTREGASVRPSSPPDDAVWIHQSHDGPEKGDGPHGG